MAWAGAEASGPRWAVKARQAAPGVLHSVATGHMDVTAVQVLTGAFDAVAAEHVPVVAFHDWEAVTGYDPDARERYVAWAKPHRGQVLTVHILVGSRLVAMGISVANLVLGGYLRAYHKREEWQRMLDAHMALKA